jgi:hypothetical protein
MKISACKKMGFARRVGLGNSNLARQGAFDYDQFVANMLAKPRPEYRRFPCVTTSWAEGNHLEPCQKWGRRYLEATRSALTMS